MTPVAMPCPIKSLLTSLMKEIDERPTSRRPAVRGGTRSNFETRTFRTLHISIPETIISVNRCGCHSRSPPHIAPHDNKGWRPTGLQSNTLTVAMLGIMILQKRRCREKLLDNDKHEMLGLYRNLGWGADVLGR